MRLSTDQLSAIRQIAAQAFGDQVAVWLFGSRVDDAARGGDIDLYLEVEGGAAEILEREMRFYAGLQRRLGEQKIDVVVHRRGSALRPIDLAARKNGVLL